MPLLNATPENIKDLKVAVAVTFADDDAPIFEDNPPGVGEARVKSLVDLLDAGPTWKPMKSSADLPEGRSVLLRADFLPFGFRCGDGVGATGQRGSGNTPGIWIGDTFYADTRGVAFTHWAEIPAFDGE